MENKFKDPELFKKEKEKILSREDLSIIGQVDKEIQPLVNVINSLPDYCTTSSCAGRITLIERKSDKKIDTKWLIASHEPVTFTQIKANLHSNHDVWLMQESFIIHIFCRTIESADIFLTFCKTLGFKRSGLTGLKKLIIETFGNEKVETIVMKKGKLLISDNYLNVLVDECNARMKKNRGKLDKLYQAIKQLK